MTDTDIRPQEGFQTDALSTEADIAILGGSAGGGKTWVLEVESSRNIDDPKYRGIIFRRTSPQITAAGGLWDSSLEIYPFVGGIPREHRLEWDFKSGSKVQFRHLQHEKDVLQHQGSEYAFIGFDELTHFTKHMFIYMLSRNRTMSNVKPYVRGTCNPDPTSWVAGFISWWIDQDTGYPIPERIGKLRYMTNKGGVFIWGDTKEEVKEKAPHLLEDAIRTGIPVDDLIKSVTFIPGSVYDNKKLLSKDPSYLANLHALDPEEKKRLLDGNWKVSLDGLEVFDYLSIDELFTNYVDEKLNKGRYITCDAARFGRDLCVIFVWDGWEVKEIHIFKKSDTNDIVTVIERLRRKFAIRKMNVLVDQDGVGGNVVGAGGYQGFGGGKPAMRDLETGVLENYYNLKTQCYYRAAEKRVNTGLIRINVHSDCIFLWEDVNKSPIRTTKIKVGSEVKDVRDFIKEDLRAIKRSEPDKEQKKKINSKEEQKEILQRSPDFGDNICMREYFELQPVRTGMVRRN